MGELFDLGWLPLAVGALAALVAGVSKAGFGSGVVAVATPMFALVVEPALAVGVMLPVLMAIDLAAVRAYWGKWAWPEAWRIIAAAALGIAAGTALHAATDPDVFRVLLGVLSVTFALYRIASDQGLLRLPERATPRILALPWGALAGFTSFISHSGGPPVMVYLLGRGLAKTQFTATLVLVFWAINLLKLPPYIALGFYAGGGAALILWLLPFALVGVRLGLWANRRVSDRVFFAVSYVFLLLAGAKLIYDGLT